MSKNCYISNMSILNLNIFYKLITYKYVSNKDYDITEQRFKRYIANIRYMLDEYHIYHISIIYDPIHKLYRLEGKI